MTWSPQDPGIITPEAVRLEVTIADAGSRGTALLVDGLIQTGIFIVLMMVFGSLLDGADFMTGAAFFTLVYFILFFAYFAVFEGLSNGQTPGKRSQKIRVTRVDGQPIGMREAVIRNLVRLIDSLLVYVVGLVSILVTKKRQRLGDIAAGTVVVSERPTIAPIALHLPPPRAGAPVVDAAGVTSSEYDVIRSYLLRRPGLPDHVAAALAKQIADAIRARMGSSGAIQGSDDVFLEEVARAYGARSGTGASKPPDATWREPLPIWSSMKSGTPPPPPPGGGAPPPPPQPIAAPAPSAPSDPSRPIAPG